MRIFLLYSRSCSFYSNAVYLSFFPQERKLSVNITLLILVRWNGRGTNLEEKNQVTRIQHTVGCSFLYLVQEINRALSVSHFTVEKTNKHPTGLVIAFREGGVMTITLITLTTTPGTFKKMASPVTLKVHPAWKTISSLTSCRKENKQESWRNHELRPSCQPSFIKMTSLMVLKVLFTQTIIVSFQTFMDRQVKRTIFQIVYRCWTEILL